MDDIVILDSDIDRIAPHLKLTKQEFKRQYLRRVKGVWYFDEYERCAFFDKGNAVCEIHPVRPDICRECPYQTPWFTKMVYDLLRFATEGGASPHLVVHMGEDTLCREDLKNRLRGVTDEFLSDVDSGSTT